MSLLDFSTQLLRDLDTLNKEQVNQSLTSIMAAANANERRNHTCYVYNELAQEFHPTLCPGHVSKLTPRQCVELTIYYLMLDIAFLCPENSAVQEISISASLREAERLLVKSLPGSSGFH